MNNYSICFSEVNISKSSGIKIAYSLFNWKTRKHVDYLNVLPGRHQFNAAGIVIYVVKIVVVNRW